MLRAIAVDDEKMALDRLERVMREEPRISFAGKFTRAEDALEFVKRNPVDVAFLDVEMPGMNGLALAEKLAGSNPPVETVFITAYDNYALKAFQVHAAGYLLKPLDIDSVREQIDILCHRLRPEPQSERAGRLIVRCFGRFSCHPEGREAEPIRWRTAKTEELFALLIHYRGQALSRERIIETLWPEAEPEKAANHFRVTCTYLRNTLAEKGFTDILARERDSYLIHTALLHCDLFAFLSAAGALQTLGLAELEEASALYAGGYLDNKLFDWASGMRLKLENMYKAIQYEIAARYQMRGEPEMACEALEKALQQDPFEEGAVERIISLKLQTGDSISAIRVYREYERRLLRELGLAPSKKLRRLIADPESL